MSTGQAQYPRVGAGVTDKNQTCQHGEYRKQWSRDCSADADQVLIRYISTNFEQPKAKLKKEKNIISLFSQNSKIAYRAFKKENAALICVSSKQV